MHKHNLKKFLHTYMFICIILIGSLAIFLNVDFTSKKNLVVLTFLINGVIILFELFKSSKLGYSLNDILYVFTFIFMFMSPLIQYIKNEFPWWDTYLFTDEKIIYSNFIIMIFLVTYISIYKISFKRKTNNYKNNYKAKKTEIKNVRLVMNIFFMATLFCSAYIIVLTGTSNLFARATNSLQVESSSLMQIISKTFRSVSVIYVAMNLLFIAKNKYIYNKVSFIIGSILMILVNFPTATARYWMASVYLGLLIILIRRVEKPHLLKIILFIGILVIFPAINVFRSNTFEEVIRQGINIPNLSDAFLSGDFDSYSMLVRSTVYVNLYGITWGNQLLGNLLFFVPRTVWPTKPIGSGAMMANELGWGFTNVSCPYVGEGYINFGILGVILFAIVLAVLTKWGDSTLMECIFSKDKKIAIIELVYPFSIGFLFFILRGDLMSSLSYYIGFMVPIILLWLMQSFAVKK